MGQHQRLRSEAAVAECRGSGLIRNPPADERELIEDYLDRFCAPLVEVVPYARRQELRREVACHLESLIDALEEVGATREEAVREALHRFGEARTLGAQWGQEWSQNTSVPLAHQQPMRITFSVYATVSLLLGLFVGSTRGINSVGEQAILLALTVFPAVFGLSLGLGVPGRCVKGVTYGLAALATVTAGIFLVFCRLINPSDHLLGEVVLGLLWCQVLFWLPISIAGAGLGGWLRRRFAFSPSRLTLK